MLNVGRCAAPPILAAASLACCACSGAPPDAAPSPAPQITREDIADVIYRPGTNDEGVLTLLNSPPVDKPSAEPVITTPADQAKLMAATTFSYQVGTTATRDGARARAWSLPEWFTLERSAFAHGTPMNGDGYLLVFSTSHAPKLLRVVTLDQSYVPTDDEWQRLAGASEVVTLTLTRAILEESRLTADGGPFVGKPIHFTVGP
jgi:hypothetical protein